MTQRHSSAASSALNQGMVDRIFWRAGFGPSAADRELWTGQPLSTLVEHFLSTPYALAPTSTPPSYKGEPVDPLRSFAELQIEWIDRMQRVTNPFIERMNFFWHRHFAVSSVDNMSFAFLLAYRDRMRRYSDFSANPTASFHDLALEMTTQDAAMSIWLNIRQNRRGTPNENYGREFMELFTLGVVNEAGAPNYSQTDVEELARAFTGYRLDLSTGRVFFKPALFDRGTKTIFGQTGSFDAPAGVQLVLSRPSHAPFLVRELWSEFIEAPIPSDAQAQLVSAYVSGGWQLAPLLRGILSNPLIFDSLEEPTMIKPPIVYTIGVLRALGVPLRDGVQTNALNQMAQQPYRPPNVAGWEGGLSWLNSSTASARFDLITACQELLPPATDLPDETPAQALARADAVCGSPWLSPATENSLLSVARQAPSVTAGQRRARQYALIAFILGGPDGQVM